MITSSSNSQIKNIISLLKKSGERKRRGLFVIEGIRMFSEIPSERIDKIYVSESFVKSNMDILDGHSYEIVSDRVFEQMSDTKTPQGIMATVKMLSYRLEDIIAGDNPLVVMLENIQDPGNLGTIIRSSEGAGVSGIIMSKDTVDIYNPKTIRSTMGALFRMPFVYAENFQEVLNSLNCRGFNTCSACLDGAVDYCTIDYSGATAIIIGNEGNGLTRDTIENSKSGIKIPMSGGLESLNAAVSTAIIAYEARRQRNM